MVKKIKTKKELLKIIDKIEKVRSKNNMNWMDLVRLSINHAPRETTLLLRKINKKDNQIAKLFKKI
jgi:hypothetical protein